MKRVFGVKKDKEPPPSLNDASDRVITYIHTYIYLYLYLFLYVNFAEFDCMGD